MSTHRPDGIIRPSRVGDGVDRLFAKSGEAGIRVTASTTSLGPDATHRGVTITLTPEEALHVAERIRSLAILRLAQLPETAP